MILLTISNACNYYADSQEQRSKHALSSNKTVKIAAVGSNNQSNLFINGITLAAKQINQRSGFLGKNIEIQTYDYNDSINKSKRIARQIAKDPEVFAVIGFPESMTAIPAAITFEKHGILFISTGATSSSFKQYDFLYSFRNVPSDKIIAKQIALFAKRNNYHKIVLFVDLNAYRQKLANFFHEEALTHNIEIVFQKTYFNWQKDFKYTLAEIKRNYCFDAFFLNGHISSAADIIKQARQSGIEQPFITNFSFDSPLLWEYIGNNATKVIVPTVFDPRHTHSKTILFVNDFYKEYSILPDTWAALGYDALHALEMASKSSPSFTPNDIASSLLLIEKFEGVTGDFSFTHDFKYSKHPVFFKTAQNNQFIYKEQNLYTKINVDEVIEERTLRLPVPADFDTLDPALIIDQHSIELCEQLFLGLTDFSKDKYEPTPELATHWTVSSDGMIYTFFLRDDVRWTDGTKVTADDIEWTIQRNTRSTHDQAIHHNYLKVLKNTEKVLAGKIKDVKQIGVKAIDGHTIRFTLEHPAAYFPALTSLSVYRPLPRHIIEKYDDQWTDIDKIVTNGSYELVHWEKERVLILQKNKDYYESEKVSIPEIRYYIIRNNQMGFMLYQQNELDIIGNSFLKIPTDELFTVQKNPEYSEEYKEVPLFHVNSFVFNMSKPPFDNILMRKALVAAINRELIKDMISKGNVEIAKLLSTPGNQYERDTLAGKGIGFSIKNAKKWIKQAGYSHIKEIGNIHYLCSESKIGTDLAFAIKENFAYYLNINVVIHILSWKDFVSVIKDQVSQEWHLLNLGFYADYPDPNNWLNDLIYVLSNRYKGTWNKDEYFQLIDAASKERNPGKRKNIYKRIENIICEKECIIAPIFHEIGHYLVKPRVKGWYNMAFGGQHIRNWSLEK